MDIYLRKFEHEKNESLEFIVKTERRERHYFET